MVIIFRVRWVVYSSRETRVFKGVICHEKRAMSGTRGDSLVLYTDSLMLRGENAVLVVKLWRFNGTRCHEKPSSVRNKSEEIDIRTARAALRQKQTKLLRAWSRHAVGEISNQHMHACLLTHSALPPKTRRH